MSIARVARGGHNIPTDVIRRRYDRSVRNLHELYVPICDYFVVINNSGETPQLVALGGLGEQTIIFDEQTWTATLGHGKTE